jgi:hypothetical protein
MYNVVLNWSPSLRGDHRLTKQKKIQMTEENIGGFLSITSTIFGCSRKYLKIHIVDSKIPDLQDLLLKRHVLVETLICKYDPWNLSWADFIRNTSRQKYSELGRYSCILKGCFQNSLVHFNSMEFFEGIKIFCELFDIDSNNHIEKFHDKADPWRDGQTLTNSTNIKPNMLIFGAR